MGFLFIAAFPRSLFPLLKEPSLSLFGALAYGFPTARSLPVAVLCHPPPTQKNPLTFVGKITGSFIF